MPKLPYYCNPRKISMMTDNVCKKRKKGPKNGEPKTHKIYSIYECRNCKGAVRIKG